MFSNQPVVLQDTGWSDYVPTGRGLFAVKNVEEAANAINKINREYNNHRKWANEIVHEYMDAEKVLRMFISQLS